MVVFDQGGMTEEEKADNPIPGVAGKEGDEDAAKDGKDKEIKEDAASGESGESDTDGGGEDKSDGEDTPPEEGADEEKGGGLGDLESFREKLLDDVKDLIKPKEEPAAPVKPPTEDEKIAIEQKYGIPYDAYQLQQNQMGLLIQKVTDMVNDRFSSFDKGNALKSLSKEKGYEDSAKYQKGVDEFLTKFDKKHHSDPEFLKMAVDASRGKSMRDEVTKAHNNGERNRRIAGAGRPSSTGGKNGQGPRPLNALEKNVASQHRMSEDEYRKFKGKKVFEKA